MSEQKKYDLVIVGAGISASFIALKVAEKGKKVLILEAGPKIPTNRNEYMQTFYEAQAKVPESPYPPNVASTTPQSDYNVSRPSVLQISEWKDPDKSYLTYSPESKHAFASTYERVAGGTTWHWLGTCLRFFENDFKMKTVYNQMVDWPITYQDLENYYGKAEHGIGVASDKQDQEEYGIVFNKSYEFPMPHISASLVDDYFTDKLKEHSLYGRPLTVSPTPQGRNSQPFDERRTCAGNTNCIPICPIQAKYDATVTLNEALQTGNVEIWHQTVVDKVLVDEKGKEVIGIHYLQYDENIKGKITNEGTVSGTRYLMAAHAIETPRILLNSKCDAMPDGVANSSGQVGNNLMDHTMYLAWGMADKPVFPYRGPLSTSGIETLRDGEFRKERASFRIEIGNEGWNWAKGDPYTTTADFIFGTNNSKVNPKNKKLFGQELIQAINENIPRQIRLGYLIEQSPEENNTVRLSKTETDHLGIPRAELTYDLSDYTKKGFVAAKETASEIFKFLGAKEYTVPPTQKSSTTFEFEGNSFIFYGAGHVVGTYRMGTDSSDSVTDGYGRSWDHNNLFMAGSGLFPTIATGNPTLTIVAVALRTADKIIEDLD